MSEIRTRNLSHAYDYDGVTNDHGNRICWIDKSEDIQKSGSPDKYLGHPKKKVGSP